MLGTGPVESAPSGNGRGAVLLGTGLVQSASSRRGTM